MVELVKIDVLDHRLIPSSETILGLEFEVIGGVKYVYAVTDSGTASWRLDGTGVTEANGGALGPAVLLDGKAGDFELSERSLDRLLAGMQSGEPGNSADRFFEPGSGSYSHSFLALGVQIGTKSFIVSTLPGGTGIGIFRVSNSGDVTASLSETTGLGDLTALATAQVDGRSFVYASSTTDGTVKCWEIAETGAMTAAGQAPAGVGIGGPSGLTPVTVNGQTYLLVTGQNSHSLSLFSIDGAGGLRLTDHILDDRSTLFGGAATMAVASIEDRAFIAVAGAEGGLTILTVLPGGQMFVLENISGQQASSLSDISHIDITVLGGELHVFITRETDSNVVHLVVDPGNIGSTIQGTSANDTLAGTGADDILDGGPGNDTLNGGNGDDILIDGDGSDVLRGGAGKDTFVLVVDGQTDTIRDFERGTDKLDLSLIPMLYDKSGIIFVPTSDGVILTMRGETLRIYSSDGKPLGANDFNNALLFNLDRPAHGEYLDVPAISGTSSSDNLAGTALGEQLFGMGGDDWMIGGNGTHVFDGGSGFDIVDYASARTAVQVDLVKMTATHSFGLTDALASVEGIRGSEFSDEIVGSDVRNTLMGGSGNDSIDGMGGDDRIFGGRGEDILNGGVGNDTIEGNEDADIIHGGAGDDAIMGQDGTDTLYGDDGDDQLFGGGDADTIYGGPGADYIIGGSMDDLLFGDDGNDEMFGGLGQDTVYGGAGDDRILGLARRDYLYGDDGSDTIIGGDGPDTLYGGAGNDFLAGGIGFDTLFGGDGDDNMEGAAGGDVLNGGNGNDALNGGGWNDSLYGEAGNDTLLGGNGNDLLDGGIGNDYLDAGQAHDTLFGGVGDDALYGRNGTDVLFGGAGDDLLDGGNGNDILTGGEGADVFIFTWGKDTITDFDPAEDRVQILRFWGDDPEMIANTYGTVVNGNLVLDFGDNHRLVIEGFTDIQQLVDLIDIL